MTKIEKLAEELSEMNVEYGALPYETRDLLQRIVEQLHDADRENRKIKIISTIAAISSLIGAIAGVLQLWL